MIRFLRRKGVAKQGEKRPYLPDVSQPVPLPHPPPEGQAGTGMTVTELSELEARAICAREDIPVFWRQPDKDKRKA
jgi:hypothetical protein